MSKHFLSRPLPMQFESYSRNKKTIELKNRHVALYHCEQKLEEFKQVDGILQMMLIEPGFAATLANIATTIKSFNKADSTKYSSDNAMKGKINDIIFVILTTKLSIEITEANFTEDAVLPNTSPQYFEYYLNNTLVDDILKRIKYMDTKYTEFLAEECGPIPPVGAATDVINGYNKCINSYSMETAPGDPPYLFEPAAIDFYKNYKNMQNIEGPLGDYPVLINYNMDQIGNIFGVSEQKVILKKQ